MIDFIALLNQINLETILAGVIEQFEASEPEFMQSVDSEIDRGDSLWTFGLVCLNLIKSINQATFEPNPNGCYLSINEERLLASCSQLVTCFTIHYNLEDHIGVSIDRLSKFGVNILKKRETIDPVTRNQRLLHALSVLNEIRKEKREHVQPIRTYFYSKHLHDLIAALIQASYSSNAVNLSDRQEITNWLENDLMEEVDGANLVSSLLMAQSGSTLKDNKVPWFTNKVGRLLTACLLRPNSVMNVIRAVLTNMDAVSDRVELASDWKKCDLVAKIIAQCPSQIVSLEAYIQLISPQILSLLFTFQPRYAKHFYRVAGSIYSQFSRRSPHLTRQHLTRFILEPIYDLEKSRQDMNVSAESFRKALNNMHLVYVVSTEPNWSTLSQIPVDLIHTLFQVYCQINKRVDCKATKAKLVELLHVYVRMMPTELEIEFLHDLLTMNLIDLSNHMLEINFESFSDEESEINAPVIFYHQSSEIVTIEMVENRCQGMQSWLKALNDPQLEIQFLLCLFSKLNEFMMAKKSSSTERSASSQILLNIENKLVDEGKQINKKIVYYTQLSILFEQIDPRLIIEKHEQVITFCEFCLNNLVKLIVEEYHSIDENKELLHLVLSVVSVFTTGFIEIEYSIKQRLQALIPLLVELKNSGIEGELGEMCDALHISLQTYCGIKTEPKSSSNRVLIEEIESEETEQSEYELAMKDARDPLIPIRAHGLVALRKLVEQKNPKCVENQSTLIDLFVKNLKNDDSYVYLAAIFGLVSLIDTDPDQILNVLIDQYMDDKKLVNVEDRMKIGEVMTKTVRNFGQLAPKYGAKLIHVFLVGTKHENEMIRSSCLSNLGELCKLLNYSLSLNIYEIINCLSSILDTDKSTQVKRSAILVSVLLSSFAILLIQSFILGS